MKKLLIIAALAVSTAGAFAQGNILFTSAARGIFDNFSAGPVSTNTPALGSKYSPVAVALLFGSSASTPLIAGITGNALNTAGNGGHYTPTNALPLGTTFSIATAWNDILNDANFSFVNGSSTWGQGSSMATTNATTTGSWSYNGGLAWQASNLTGGTTYNMYIIGWDATYATPTLAAAANAAVGWSSYFSYTPATGINTPPTFSGLGTPFGVVGAVPEPGTMALAALGGASLLLFRRRK